MNFLPVLYLSFRNYFRHISRYALILCSLIIVTMVMITFLAVTAGVRASVLSKTSRYFAGDITVQAFELNKSGIFERVSIPPSPAFDNFQQWKDQVKIRSRRSVYLRNPQWAELFFNGNYIYQRRVIGVDWGAEEQVIRGMSLDAGTIPPGDDMDGILISTSVAENLGVKVGDQVLLAGFTAVERQRNTRMFIVRGIFNEGSVFEYACYIHREAVNDLFGLPRGYANEAGIFLNGSNSRRTRDDFLLELRRELEKSM